MDSPLTQRPSNASFEDVEFDNQTTDPITSNCEYVSKSTSSEESKE